MKIYIACLHVGQKLFAVNKYLLLKRITVCCQIVSIHHCSDEKTVISASQTFLTATWKLLKLYIYLWR
jgi:hypothetical protein